MKDKLRTIERVGIVVRWWYYAVRRRGRVKNANSNNFTVGFREAETRDGPNTGYTTPHSYNAFAMLFIYIKNIYGILMIKKTYNGVCERGEVRNAILNANKIFVYTYIFNFKLNFVKINYNS